MERYIHKIAPSSPLLIDVNAGYEILHSIASRQLEGLLPISVGDKQDFLANPSYSTEYFASAVNLAQCLTAAEPDCVENAWAAVLNAAIELYCVRKDLFKTGLDVPIWNSVSNWGAKLVRELDVFHCAACTLAIKLLFRSLNDAGAFPNRCFDSLCHGDVHAGNVLKVGDAFRIIDLENIHIAPAYTDLFLYSLTNQGASTDLVSACQKLAKVVGRPPSLASDFVHALAISLYLAKFSNSVDAARLRDSIHDTLVTISRDAYLSGI